MEVATKTIRLAVMGVFALTMACGTLLAQNRVSDFIHLTPPLEITPFVPDSNPATVTIYSDLGPSTTDEYNDTDGYCVAGSTPTGATCSTDEQWIGMPFTPKQGSHATQLQVAVGIFAGTNAFELALYNDVSGLPGTPLKTVEIHNAPTFGSCCTLVIASLGTPGVALTAGTQYWVVAQADDTHAPTFTGAWALANNFIAYNAAQGGWANFPSAPEAGAVKGTVP
jgi:hypothetical protein